MPCHVHRDMGAFSICLQIPFHSYHHVENSEVSSANADDSCSEQSGQKYYII